MRLPQNQIHGISSGYLTPTQIHTKSHGELQNKTKNNHTVKCGYFYFKMHHVPIGSG